MKNSKILIVLIALMISSPMSYGQFLKKLKDRAEDAAKEAVLRKAEEKVNRETERAMDTILDGNKGKKKKNKNKSTQQDDDQIDEINENDESSEESVFGYYSNFTFIPGNKLLFYDDFATDAIGDFPANWETGGSGEIVTTSDSEYKWLSMIRRSGYLPTLEKILPEDYTIEFDIANNGYDAGKANSKINFLFMSKKSYSGGSGGSLAEVEILLSSAGFNVRSVSNFGGEVEIKVGSSIDRVFPEYLNNTVHISIAVNKKRLRMWVNEDKLVDSPNLLQANIGDYFIIQANNILPEQGHFVGISNFRIAEAKEDLRSLLLKNGKFSTTGIYFDTSTWKIKNESYGIIKEIATMLQENPEINMTIVGHTDNVGESDYNQMLSENRADAVKQILTEEFSIAENRLSTQGKGETEPLNDNATESEKANNRRVEFIKN
jgi:outer membrane protein OmpA-like peptidoglycan-associated protein